VEDVNFLAPFKFYRNEPRVVTILVSFTHADESIVADCRLVGNRILPNQTEPQVTTHFTGRIRLTKLAPASATVKVPKSSESFVGREDIYRTYFHGPAYQVLERAWRNDSRMIGEMAHTLPANHQPSEAPLFAVPRLIELCFQTAGLLEMDSKGCMGLPLHIDRISMLRVPESVQGTLYAIAAFNSDGTSFDTQLVDSAGNVHLHMAGYRTIALPNAVDLSWLQQLHPTLA